MQFFLQLALAAERDDIDRIYVCLQRKVNSARISKSNDLFAAAVVRKHLKVITAFPERAAAAAAQARDDRKQPPQSEI